MATQERLQKSLEVLKALSQLQSSDQSRKKEKIHHCYVVSEAISNPTIKVSANFHVLLGVTLETFLKLCDDPDADIRMTSDECLNRIIRAVTDGHTGKVQIELHKEIKKNGPSRSLRAALVRFSHLAHHIRTHKGKPYVINLFPSIIKIACRTEESVHETLAASLPQILKSLGIFAPDNDIKILLKAFLQNIVKPSASVRRTSSSCICSICMHSRRPYVFVTYCLHYLIDIVVPVDANQSSCSILGILHCLKVLLPFTNNVETFNKGVGSREVEVLQKIPTNKLLQVYELCIYYLSSTDHNIINAALDTLNTLLLNATKDLQEKLLSPNGIDKNRIHKSLSLGNIRSPSQLSIAATTASSDQLFSELTETMETDIVKWIGESKLSVMNVPHVKSVDKTDSGETIDSQSELSIAAQYYETPQRLPELSGVTTKSSSINDNLDALSSRSSEESIAGNDEKILESDSDCYEAYIGDYLDKSVSLAYCTRLITKYFLLSGIRNQYISDKNVRVSVKASALTCLCAIFKIYPYGFYMYLDKNFPPSGETTRTSQKIDDIILLADHPDPQLRGIVRCMAADVLIAILNKTNLDFGLWEGCLSAHTASTGIRFDMSAFYGVKEFVAIWVKGLQDENSNCLRQSLLSLKISLDLLSESSSCNEILPVLEIIPTLANNPYWLVKVALCEVLSNISYITIHHNLGDSLFQKRILYNVLFEFLKDSDQRIRSATSTAILSVTERLYSEDYHPKEHTETTKGISFINKYFPNLQVKENTNNVYWTHFVENLPFPYSRISSKICDRIDYVLSTIVMKLYTNVIETRSKYFIYGCIEALSALSNKYPCTIYIQAWGISDNYRLDNGPRDNIKDLLGLCVNLLNSSAEIYDIPFMINLMNLTFNLYAGYTMVTLKQIDLTEKSAKTWPMLSDESLKAISDQYLLHVVRLLNIFHHVIGDLVPAPPQSKTVLPQLPSTGTLSPMKKRKNEDKKSPLSSAKMALDKDEKSEKKEIKMIGIGCFAGSQHYMKIFEMLRNAFVNYKISLDPTSSESFLELLRKTIQTLCVIMEIGTLNEFGRISEEILGYLKTAFSLDRSLVVQCVQQLLKCLFGTNLTANLGDILNDSVKDDDKEENYSFYYNMFQKPYEETSSCIQSLNSISKVECDGDSTIMGYLHRRDVKKPSSISRTSDKTLANYIRIFEPIVINSLKQYTVTSDVAFQCQVLKLLSQLVQLRVNYCLLDSEQVFKDFVLKQFEYIEEGLVARCDELIPKIFQFLVQLSYPKQHSKSIIDVPKIIQLCDGLMASGQDPITHCLPALEPIVEDVFLVRSRSNTTDMKELETTREVVLAMLLRLLEYKEVIDLLTLVLEDSKYCTDDTEKWLRWSGQVANVFLQMLRLDKIRIDNFDTFLSLKKMIFALNPNVFRPIDDVIVMLFQEPPSLHYEYTLNRWLSKVTLLLFIISPLREDDLLTKITLLKIQFNPGSIFENFTATADPLNVYNNADAFQNIPAEAIIARLIFRIISIVSVELAKNGLNTDEFFLGEFSIFLMYCSHIFQSGSLCKVSQITASLLTQPTRSNSVGVDAINKNFVQIQRLHPIITFQWCHILSILNYNCLDFWKKIIGTRNYSINDCLVQNGGSIVFCDYLNENISETKQLLWILSEHSKKLVQLIDEIPVSEFISFVHRNATLSKMFVTGITQNCLNYQNCIFKTKILKAIENCHPSQTGASIKLLIPKMLSNRQIAISRMVAQLASRKIEYLFTLSKEEVLKQLTKEDLFIIKEELNVRNMAKKHETLVCLLNKLLVSYYDMSPLEFTQTRMVHPEYIRKLETNKKWFLSQVQGKYQDGMLRKETSKVMERLEYNELLSFMSSDDFNKIIFKDCIERGVKMLREGELKEEPPILRATIDIILKEVSRILNELYESHEIFRMNADKNSHSDQRTERFNDEIFTTLIQNLCLAISSLMKHLCSLPTLQVSEIDCENISKFAVIALELIHFILINDKNYVNINFLEALLDCSNEILKESQFCSYLGLDQNVSWLCSAIDSLHYLVQFLLKDQDPLPSVQNICDSENPETREAQKSCHRLYTLTCWLYKIQKKRVGIPTFLLHKARSLIVSLSRLPMVNSFNLVPKRVWKLGWQPEFSGKFSTQVSPIPIDMLQEIDVLEEYIFRISLLGWTTRQQFEESWMCFLSVLCTPLDNLDSADIDIARRASSFAIKAITAQLLQTLRYPVLGNKNVSSIMHVSRNEEIPENTISIKKLKIIQDQIQSKSGDLCINFPRDDVKNVFFNKNFEKIDDRYSYGQMSIRYFWFATGGAVESNSPDSCAQLTFERRTKLLDDCGLDVNSCLQFLLDYFTQLMQPESAVTDIRILHETVKSTLYISDIFTDKAQFSWMLDIFLDLTKIHAAEDELIHQYLIIGICKAVGVLNPDLEVYEQAKKLLVQFLKSPFMPTKISCLHGLLYILEGCMLSNIAVGGVSEQLQLILPCAVEYVQSHMNTNSAQSQEHSMLVWSLAFYLIENVDEVHMESNFVVNTLQSAVMSAQNKSLDCEDKYIIKGLERLLLLKPMYVLEKIGKNLQKLALDKMRDENPSVSILGLQLLVTYMYVDCWEHLEKPEPDNEQSSPDYLVQTIEKISAIFERIKKSYVREVEMLCSILPMILRDFFSPSDILTKVIGEFLSPQQPHPRLMSEVVFQVFDSAIELNQLSLLQDWVVFSLSNFTQSFSNMATWSLTCFFISASPNKWLKAFFPFVQNRVGRYEYEDKKIFCIAGADFYKNLTNDNQRKTFVDNFVKVKDHADMPFSDLLNSL